MPYAITRRHKRVYHIGHIDPGSITGSTKDGPGLAVSTNPDHWRAIAGLNGPQWELSCPHGEWVDVLQWDDSDHAELIAWMLNLDYMTEATIYTTMVYDEARDEIDERNFQDRKLALSYLADKHCNEECLSSSDSYVLTRRALAKLGGTARYTDPCDWFSAAAYLYVSEVISLKRSLVVGLWWDTPNSLEAKLGSYGMLLPHRMGLFDVAEEAEYPRPATERLSAFIAANPDFELEQEKANRVQSKVEAGRRILADILKQ